MRFTDLQPGQHIQNETIVVESHAVQRYLDATGDDTDVYWSHGRLALVPPMAIAAFGFQALMQVVTVAPGTLHTGQELTFHQTVPVGSTLVLSSQVATLSSRRGLTSLLVETTASTRDGTLAMRSRMSLLLTGGTHGSPVSGHVRTPDIIPAAFRVTPHAYQRTSLTADDLLPIVRVLTQDRLDAYAVASGDFNPLHIDREFAATTPFGQPIAHGMLVLSFLSTALTRAVGMPWLYDGQLKVRFRSPVPVDSTVTAGGTVKHREGDAVQYAVYALQVMSAAMDPLITGEARARIGALVTGV